MEAMSKALSPGRSPAQFIVTGPGVHESLALKPVEPIWQ